MKVKRIQKGMSEHKTKLVERRLTDEGIKSRLQYIKSKLKF
ncbi:MAG: hypothetical protein ACOC5L_02220 [Halobacteriota archaeon]